MSIYESYAKYNLLDEADDDDNTSNGQTIDLNSPDTDDNNQNAGNDQGNNDQQQQDQNNDDQNQNDDNQNQDNNDQNQNNNQDNGGDDEFDINTNDAGDDNQEDTGDNNDTQNTEDDNETKEDEVENPELDQIYDTLTDKEKAIRDYQLRQNILAMHKTAGGMIEQLSLLPKISQTNKQIKVLMGSLYSFRKYIIFYIKNTYSTKTLVENTIQYYKYLGILGTYKEIFKNLEDIMAHPIDKK